MADIIHRVGIDAKPEKIFEALTSTKAIMNWWDSKDATGDAKDGEVFHLTWASFKVIQAKPNELVRWKVTKAPEVWLDTEISFKLVWKDNQTFVLFTHANWKKADEYLAHSSMKWAGFLLSLKEYVEEGFGRPAPFDTKVYVGERR